MKPENIKTAKTVIIVGIVMLILFNLMKPRNTKVIIPAELPKSTPTVMPTAIPTESPVINSGWTNEQEMAYLNACFNSDKSNLKFCYCSFGLTEKNYTPAEISQLNFSKRTNKGKLPQKFTDIVSFCLKQYPY